MTSVEGPSAGQPDPLPRARRAALDDTAALPLRSVACAAVVAALLGTWPVRSAAASCVGPVLAVGPVAEEGTGQPDAVLKLAAVVTVDGEWFRTGCDDAGQGSGCGAPASEEAPMDGVVLRLEQGTTSASLGTSDAADRDDRYAIRWRVRVPPRFEPGPAELTAGGAVLPVELTGG